jgi:hypothetical protein
MLSSLPNPDVGPLICATWLTAASAGSRVVTEQVRTVSEGRFAHVRTSPEFDWESLQVAVR